MPPFLTIKRDSPSHCNLGDFPWPYNIDGSENPDYLMHVDSRDHAGLPEHRTSRRDIEEICNLLAHGRRQSLRPDRQPQTYEEFMKATIASMDISIRGASPTMQTTRGLSHTATMRALQRDIDNVVEGAEMLAKANASFQIFFTVPPDAANNE